MAHPYGHWSHAGVKREHAQGERQLSGASHIASSSRRSEGGDHQPHNYLYPDTYHQDYQHRRPSRHSPPSAMNLTSSLSGAMGDLQVPSHAPSSGELSPSGMAWAPSPTAGASEGYVMISGNAGGLAPYLATPPTPLTSGSPSGAFVSYDDSYNMSSYTNAVSDNFSIPSQSAGSSSPAYPDHLIYHGRHSTAPSVMSTQTPSPTGVPLALSSVSSGSPVPTGSRSSRPSPDLLQEEVLHLRNKVRELELINRSARDRIKELEHEIARTGYGPPSSVSTSGLPSPIHTPTPVSPSFEETWRSRTDARVKLFCSLNRAGNALCAWHDSRRERRAYPPRMSPRGVLNCSCTYEEALFEESLARHGVGSYHPGESVRMDPALRNPLLKLLQSRYGYRDGDFERDPTTGGWLPGEGPALWESKAASGAFSTRKTRGDERH